MELRRTIFHSSISLTHEIIATTKFVLIVGILSRIGELFASILFHWLVVLIIAENNNF